MLDGLWESIGTMASPFYMFGAAIWKGMLSLIGVTAATAPDKFSTGTWAYVVNDLQTWTLAIGAILLNISCYIGIIRQAGNLKQDMTLEYILDNFIKVVLANALMLSLTQMMKQFFGMAGDISKGILLEDSVVFLQKDVDMGSVLFYMLFGFIYMVACLVCSGIIFGAVYGRYLQLYLLVATGPVTVGTLPGGHGMSQTFYAWFRTFLAKTFEIVMIAMGIGTAAKMCNDINFGTVTGLGGEFDGALQAVQNMCTMVLLTATVKGMDAFMRRAFAL